MKTIGLIGGMSWESTVPYYQTVNEVVKERLGGLHSGQGAAVQRGLRRVEACQASGDWARSAGILGEAAKALEGAGATSL